MSAKNTMNKEASRCVTCGKTFSQRSSQTPLSCATCRKTFKRQGNIQDGHKIDMGFSSCPLCVNFPSLSLHVTRATVENGKTTTDSLCHLHTAGEKVRVRKRNRERAEKLENGRYPCELCNKTFSRSDGLSVHVRVHTGERPYSCEICTKSFSYLSVLTKHMRVHAQEHTSKRHCDKTYEQLREFYIQQLEDFLDVRENIETDSHKITRL